MVVKLYLDFLSQPCRAVYIFCKLEGIEFQQVDTSLFKGEHKTAEYKKMFPIGGVPCLSEDGWNLSESMAILSYLAASKKPKGCALLPSEPQARARVEQFLHWHHTGIRKGGVGVFVTVIFQAKMGDKPIDKPLVKEKVADLETSLNQMETYFLKDTKYVAGDKLTAADLVGYCEVFQPYSIGYDVGKGRPKLTAWMERVKKDMKEHYAATHTMLEEFGVKYKTDFVKELA